MLLTRIRQAVLLGLALLLAVPVAHARKDDEERGRNDRREQQYEQRRADDGRNRQQRDDRRERAPEPRRYERRELRGDPAYSEPRRRYVEPRRYEEAPRRYEESGAARPRGYSDSQPRYAPPGLSLSEAVMEAERRSGGRVLSAEPGSDGGQPYYRVKVLSPNGRVQIYYIDAR